MKLTMLQLSTDEEPGPRATKLLDRTKETTALDKEDINQDQAEKEIPETTATGMANTATSAKSRGTDKKNAGRG